MNLLFVSNLFPDRGESVRGLDNATLLHWLRETQGVEIRVISPRPGFRAGTRSPRSEDAPFSPAFPRVSYVPRFGSRWNDRLMRMGLEKSFRRIVRDFRPDVVLGSWLFPDGCALAPLCEQAQLPLVLVTQGSDTHQYLKDAVRRRKIIEAIGLTRTVICRSGDLAKRLSAAGVPAEKLVVIYNGIDPAIFHTVDRDEARQRLGLPPEPAILLFVGNLLPVKNPLFLLRAHAALNERRAEGGLSPARLQLIGKGPMEPMLRREASRLGTSDFVDFLGQLPPREVALHMNAADALCLSSLNEGFPNVLLEAMACGLPIVSTDVGGIREKISEPANGRLVIAGDAKGYVDALEGTLRSAERGSSAGPSDLAWESVADDYFRCLREAIALGGCSTS